VVPAATLNATSSQTFTTTLADGHSHNITLTTANLATIKGGGTVTVASTVTNSHMHMFAVTCT
jgi:hypothetical protein